MFFSVGVCDNPDANFDTTSINHSQTNALTNAVDWLTFTVEVSIEGRLMTSLDEKIQEVERQIAAARQTAGTIPGLVKTLQHLKRTKSMLTGEPEEPITTSRRERAGKPSPGSIGDHAVKILREASAPMYIADIHGQLTSQGMTVEMGSLSGVLATYVKKGWVERVETGYYRAPHPPDVEILSSRRGSSRKAHG